MNITIFTDAWDPQINGVVTTLKTTIKHLEKRGHTVEVVHPGMFKVTVPLQPSTGIFMPLLPMRSEEHTSELQVTSLSRMPSSA